VSDEVSNADERKRKRKNNKHRVSMVEMMGNKRQIKKENSIFTIVKSNENKSIEE